VRGGRLQKDRLDPDIIRISSGGGCLTVFGIPFFLVGILALLTCVGVLPLRGDGGELSLMAAGLFGAVFTGVGGVLIFGRSGLIIDRGRNQVVQWQGLVIPLKRIVHRLDRFVAVRLERDRQEKSILYKVQLKGDDATETIAVESLSDYGRARQAAEELSRFLRKPMEDRSTGRTVIRDPGHLDESFRDRFRRLGQEISFAPQPVTLRTGVERTAEGVALAIPAAPMGLRHLLPLTVALAFAGIAAFWILPGLLSLPAPPVVQVMMVGFIGFFALLLPILTTLRDVARSRGGSTRITASRAGLRVEEKEKGGTRVTDIPAGELEDLEFIDRRSLISTVEVPGMEKGQDFGDTGTPRLPDGRPVPRIILALMRLAPTKGITARSDRAIVTFGQGLPEDELAYLFALIVQTLTD